MKPVRVTIFSYNNTVTKQEQFLLVIFKKEMPHSFKTGDRVTWNSEAGQVSGKIIRIHTGDFNYKGYTHHATDKDPQYEIKSDRSDHIAVHKGSALTRI